MADAKLYVCCANVLRFERLGAYRARVIRISGCRRGGADHQLAEAVLPFSPLASLDGFSGFVLNFDEARPFM